MSGSSGQGARDTHDVRLVPAAAAAWSGMWLASSGQVMALMAAGMATFILGAVAVGRKSLPAALACVVLAGSLLTGGLRAHALSTGPVADLASEKAVVVLLLTVTTEPTRSVSRLGWGDQVRLRGDVVQVDGRGHAWTLQQAVDVEASGDRVESWVETRVGATVRFSGRLAVADPADGVAAIVRPLTPPERVSDPPWWLDAVERVRDGLRAAVAGLPADQRALVPALTLGDTSQVTPTMTAEFRATGLTHLMAVSGANLALLLSFVMLLARWCGVRGRWLTLVGVVTVVVFVALCRAEPSVVRSAAMGVVALAAVGREATTGGGLRLISVAVIGLCFVDPWLSRSWGFALSVAACVGIVWWGRRWAQSLGQWLPGWLSEAVAVPLAAQIATQPLVTALSGSVSVAGVPANALAGPFVGPATVLGFAAAGVAWLVPWSGQLLAWGAGWAAEPILMIARYGASFPGATIRWPASAFAMVLVVAGSVSIGLLAPWVLRRWWLVLPIAVLMVVAMLRAPYHLGWPPASWQVVACDVGQGDATLVEVVAGQAILVDTGPDPVALLACLDQLGVDAIPLLVLTHYHADHAGGLEALLGSRPIGRVVLSPLESPAATARAVVAELTQRGIPVSVAHAGQELIVVDARWQTIWADAEVGAGVDSGESSAENNASIVGRVSVPGLSVLVTGDIEPEGQAALLAAGDDVRATLMKVPHHGSSRQDPDFLAATEAKLALVEVGLDNTYGHPAPKTLRALEALGMQVVRTDQQGAVAIGTDDGRQQITTLR